MVDTDTNQYSPYKKTGWVPSEIWEVLESSFTLDI